MNFELRLTQLLKEEIIQAGGTPPSAFAHGTVLAETGLDSLGFAALMVAMEKEFGLDPFGSVDEIVYPETFADLVNAYQEASHARGSR